jgi:hypothetical protein
VAQSWLPYAAQSAKFKTTPEEFMSHRPITSTLRRPIRAGLTALAAGALLTLSAMPPLLPTASAELVEMPAGAPRLLNQPYLQLPTSDSVRVVWHTNFPGIRHELIWGEGRNRQRTSANTERMQRMLEDGSSRSPATAGLALTEVVERPVWRHEAIANGLQTNRRVPYRIRSIAADGSVHISPEYSLQPLPGKGQPLRILLTSDQQNRYGFPAAMQKLEETFGAIDAVFFAGDYVDNPRQASEWFDRFDPAWLNNPGNPGTRPFPSTRPAFFPSMQGTYGELFPQFPWRGGAVLQHAVKYGAIGNHEQPGRYRPNARIAVNNGVATASIGYMDNDPQPRWYAEMRYEELKVKVNPSNDPAVREQWISDNSHDWNVFRQMWTHPQGPEGEQYYMQVHGDVAVVVLNVSRIWRTWNVGSQDRGKFTEFFAENRNPDEWGFGDFHFERFDRNSDQFAWLSEVLARPEFRNARYRVVVAHHTVAGLGDNAAPAHSDNVMQLDLDAGNGLVQTREVRLPADSASRAAAFKAQVEPVLEQVVRVRYEYPLDEDIWKNDVEPLLVQAGVQLVHIGHSHVYSHVRPLHAPTLNYLESSSGGNSFGAFWTQGDGTPWRNARRGGNSGLFAANSPWNLANYPRTDDPHGRAPQFPTLANPMQLWGGEALPVPFVASNDISTFSVLDTGIGAVRSFAIDLRNPSAPAVEFDRIPLLPAQTQTSPTTRNGR